MSSYLDQADELSRLGRAPQALQRLRQFFEQEPSLRSAMQVITRIERLGAGLALRRVRVFFARSFTIEPMFPLLRALGMLNGVDFELRAGEFNTWEQEALDPASPLFEFDPDLVFLAVQTRDLAPALWSGATGPEVEAPAARIERWLTRVRQGSRASVVMLDFAHPPHYAAGLLDAQDPRGQAAAIDALNRALRESAQRHGAHLLGYDALVANFGRARWYDEVRWLTARMPIAAAALPTFASACLAVACAALGISRKVLVLDLDNTLWGGVVGESGVQGIELGGEYPGAAYLEFQKAILRLKARGVLLAIASKNNEADALEVLDTHPAMLLRRDAFAAMRINWQEKSQSLREIAAELNVGLDALVFVDDNPAECERMRLELPEVLTIELPSNPMLYAGLIAEYPGFERLAVSEEDRRRTEMYREQRERRELVEQSGSLEEFYASLQMELRIERAGPANVARIAQLTQKTNQFNLTTRRYSEEEVRRLAEAPAVRVYAFGLRDRFGDNGIVGVAICRFERHCCELDTLLMSCRVIGRTVETAMLAHVLAEARAVGATRLIGWYLETPKNKPAAEVYARHGFQLVEERGRDQRWEAAVAATCIEFPEWIRVETVEPLFVAEPQHA